MLFVTRVGYAQSSTARTIPFDDAVLEARIDALVEPFIEAQRFSGVLLIAQGDRVHFHKAYGFANYEHAVPNTLETTFSIASITKPLTNRIVQQLINEGKLRGEDPLRTWI